MTEERSGASETGADGQRTIPTFTYPQYAPYVGVPDTLLGEATIDLGSNEIVIKLGDGPHAQLLKHNLRTVQKFYLSGFYIREDMKP